MAKETAKHYPKRDRFFAHKFTRRLMKSCAAMDIGRDACLLLTYVAHTEDAARYSGPVRFWNDQLSNVLGFNSPKQLVNARTKAVEGGWLVYSRHHNRGVGRYWVTIPKQFDDLDDSLIEEVDDELLSNHSAGGTNQEVNHSTNRSDNGMKKGRKAEHLLTLSLILILSLKNLTLWNSGKRGRSGTSTASRSRRNSLPRKPSPC